MFNHDTPRTATLARWLSGDPYAADHVEAAGGTITQARSAREALMVGGLDWQVGLTPVYVQHMDDTGVSTIEVPGRRAVQRLDNGHPLGVVSKRYRPVQNRTLAEFVDTILDTDTAEFLGMGLVEGGRRVYGAARLTSTAVEWDVPDETVDIILMVMTSHDATASFTASVLPLRLACANGLRYTIKGASMAWRIRHTAAADVRVYEARRALGMVSTYTEAWEDDMRRLLDVPVMANGTSGYDVVCRLVPIPDDVTDRTRAVRQSKRDGIMDMWLTSDNLGNIRNTAFGFVNAVAEWEQWGRPSSSPERNARTLFVSSSPTPLTARAHALVV